MYYISFCLVLSTLTLVSCSSTNAILSKVFDSDDSQVGYEIYYQEGNKLIIHNSLTEKDSTLYSGVNIITTPLHFSSDSSRVGMNIYGQDGSVTLAVLDFGSKAITTLETLEESSDEANLPSLISFAWSPTGDKICFGTYKVKVDGQYQGVIQQGVGKMSIVDLSTMVASDMGCTKSKIVEFWSPTKGLLVGNGESWYMVDEKDCSVVGKVEDPKEIWAVNYSPTADGYTYYLPKELYLSGENYRMIKVWELYLVNNEGQKKLICPSVGRPKPGSEVWSPDGTMIAFESRSQEWKDLITTNIYVLESELLYAINADTYAGPLDCTNPQWSPEGNKLSYTTSGPIFKTNVVMMDIADNSKEGFNAVGKASWIDTERIVTVEESSRYGTALIKVYNTSIENEDELAEKYKLELAYLCPGRVLHIRPIH